MEITIFTFLIVCPLVFCAGFVDAIAGGGGIISLPAYLIAGVPPHFALGSNKMSSAMGTIISTLRFLKNGYVDLKLAPFSIILAIIGSMIGANIALLINESIMEYLLIFVLPVVAFFVFMKKDFDNSKLVNTISRKKQICIALLASFFVGGYDGFYGPGAGTFLILIYTSIAKMDIKIASGNTKIVNLSANIAALVTFIINGKIVFILSLTAGIFSIAGHYIGSSLVLKNGSKVVRPIILVVLILLFIKIIFG